jgi:hypothetical protein
MAWEEPGDSHSIIGEWEGYGWCLCQMRVDPESEHGKSEMQYFSESQTFCNFSLPQNVIEPCFAIRL